MLCDIHPPQRKTMFNYIYELSEFYVYFMILSDDWHDGSSHVNE